MNPSEPLSRRIRRLKIEEQLRSFRCVLWPSVSFDLTDDEELAAATAWVERIMDSVG